MVKVLIDAGADVNAKTRESLTPLIAASYKKNLKMMLLLIDAGADWNIKIRNITSKSVYFYENLPENMQKIIREKYPEKYNELKKILDKEEMILKKYKPAEELMYAAANADINKVKMLINKGVDINIKFDPNINNGGNNNKNKTALIFALAAIFRSGKTPIVVDELINAGIDLNVQDNEHGRTALIEAAYMSNIGWSGDRSNGLYSETYEYIEMLKNLIKAGAKLDIKDNYGKEFFYYLKNDIKEILIREFPKNDYFIKKEMDINIIYNI
jgi:ankyrin repeat protein